MIGLWSMWALLALVALGAAEQCCPQVSLLDDVRCITKGARNFFTLVVNGHGGGSPPMNVIRVESLRSLKQSGVHRITNIELKGMTNCIVRKLALDVYSQSYEHIVYCPELVSTFYYTSRDDPLHIVKKCTITAPHYDVVNVGRYGINVSPNDYLPHCFIQSVNTRAFPRQKLACYSDGVELKVRNADLEFIHYLIVRRCMKIVLAGINVYFERHSMGEAFPRCNEEIV